MHPSPSSGGPRVLHCPHCGAPLEAVPFAPMARCKYCGHQVQLQQSAPPPARYPLPPAPTRGAAARLVSVLLVVPVVAGALLWYVALRPSTQPAPASAATMAAPALERSVRPPAPAVTAAHAVAATQYPMRSLLGVSPTVDVDGSRAHLASLFPSVTSSQLGDELRFVVPLSHPWFSEAELHWKNEKMGKLVSVAFRPPQGKDKLENQKEISECLSKGLGKPEVRETDHLAGELSYFWGAHWPKAWLDLYSTYLWLAFEDPKGVAPITLAQVVHTLDGCASVAR